MSGDLVLQFLTVNYYSAKLINKLLSSLENLSIDHRVIVVNNSPEDQSIHNLIYPNLEIIEAHSNLGFGRACNLALTKIYRQSPTDLVWLINPDAYFEREDITKIPDLLALLTSCPILGTVIYDNNYNLTFSGGKFDYFWGTITEEKAQFSESIKPTQWVSGCSLIINLLYFNQCPNFDGDFFLYYEDFEFCRRYNKLGYGVGICSQIKVIHHRSSITNNLSDKLSLEIYSYLLALLKQGSKVSLFYRLFRIILIAILFNNQGRVKLQAVKKFIRFYLAHSLGWRVQRD